MISPSDCNVTSRRSTLRDAVRAKCRWAETLPPDGRIKFLRGGSSASSSSIKSSSAWISASVMKGKRPSFLTFVTSEPERVDVFDGEYVLELRGDSSSVVRNLGDLTGKTGVVISFYGAVSSLGYNFYNPEHMDMDFYDGTDWQNGVVTFTREDNDEGYQLRSFEVEPDWLSADNRIRFSARADNNGDFFYVDNVTIASAVDPAIPTAVLIPET